ncbi:MAG: hypothetical protein EXS38_08825 [Opitutus sp.]|nr:hypothetical protein [Opitutus sp.]
MEPPLARSYDLKPVHALGARGYIFRSTALIPSDQNYFRPFTVFFVVAGTRITGHVARLMTPLAVLPTTKS